MKNTIFWNENDAASLTFVKSLRKSGILKYVSFTSFAVRNPQQQDEGVNKLLQILEVHSLPTLFFQGQAFHGRAAFEWLEYQMDGLTAPPEERRRAPLKAHDGPVDENVPSGQVGHHGEFGGLAAGGMDDMNYTPFISDSGPSENPQPFGANPFNNVTSGSSSRGGISEAALAAAENARKAQVPVPPSRS